MLHFDGAAIRITHAQDKTLDIPELLETYNALGDAPLAAQYELFRQIVPSAKKLGDTLSEAARRHLDFWEKFRPERVDIRKFSHSTTIRDTYSWAVEIREDGVYYVDMSGMYSQKPRHVTAQGFSDFWFYGPLLPVPDRLLRQQLIEALRAAFRSADGLAYNAHFPLLDYPKYENYPRWNSGDYVASDFVNMRAFGVDYGRQNFRDGLVYHGFISFEHCITRPEFARRVLGDEVWADIIQEFGYTYTPADTTPQAGPPPLSKRIAAWKETHDPEIEQELIERALTASALDRQEISNLLWRHNQNEAAVKILLSLLEEKDPDDYWRNYVFRMLFDMAGSPAARAWIDECLNGSNEIYRKKAADVQFIWKTGFRVKM